MQAWSLVDFSGFFYNISLYRRNGDKETVANTVTRMSNPLPAGSLVVGDSYFGNISTLEALSLEGKYGLFSCTSIKPSFLFKGLTEKSLSRDNDCSSVYGVLPQSQQSFLANAFQSQGRKLYTLSTAFSSELETVEIQAFIDDGMGHGQHIPSVASEKRPQVRNKYSEYMDFNDCANAATLDATPKTRKHHWTSAVMMWLLPMLYCVNGKHLYQSATGRCITNQKWRVLIRDALSDYHTPCKIDKGIRGRCRVCSSMNGKDSRTNKICFRCGPVCKKCESMGLHTKYARLLKRNCIPQHRQYTLGNQYAKELKRKRKSVQNLVY